MKYLFVMLLAFTLTSCNAKAKSSYELLLDSMYISYVCKADAVLQKYSKRSIEGYMMADAYIECYKKYQIEVPLELALAQAQLETAFGKYNANNPYNIRHPKKNYKLYNTPQEGVSKYYDLMCRRYLSCHTWEELLKNFVNCDNKRYAESRTYEVMLKDVIKGYRKIFINCTEVIKD